MKKEKILSENEIELEDDTTAECVLEEPDVIHINENDDERVREHEDDEDKDGNFFERFFGKRPSEKALKKISIASFILGVLSCSLLFGNLITSALGILLALKNEKHKYRSFFSTAGFILNAIGVILGVTIIGIAILLSVIGLICGVIIVAMVIMIPIVVILLAVIAIVIAVVLMAVISFILMLVLIALVVLTILFLLSLGSLLII